MKIYVLDAFHLSGVELAEKQAEVIRWDDPRAKNWHEDADGLMVRGKKIAAEDMARAKKLRVISKQGVGLDNIDLEAAKAHGIVANFPGQSVTSCGQPSHVAWCGSHSAGMRYARSLGLEEFLDIGRVRRIIPRAND